MCVYICNAPPADIIIVIAMTINNKHLFYSYRGEKLDRFPSAHKRKKLMKDVLISTVYDEPEEVEDTQLRSGPSTTLKHRTTYHHQQPQHAQHRDTVQFLGAGTLKPSQPHASNK